MEVVGEVTKKIKMSHFQKPTGNPPVFGAPCKPPEGANFAIGIDGMVYVGSDFTDEECVKVRGGMADYEEAQRFNRIYWKVRAQQLGFTEYTTYPVDIWKNYR